MRDVYELDLDGGKTVIVSFDKNGGLYDMQPRVPQLFSTYYGRTILCLNDVVEDYNALIAKDKYSY